MAVTRNADAVAPVRSSSRFSIWITRHVGTCHDGEPHDFAARLQLRDAGAHRVARQAQPRGEVRIRRPRVVAQGCDQSLIRFVQFDLPIC